MKNRKKLFQNNDTSAAASPNDLQTYMRVSSPSIWIVVTALVIVLLSACVWCFFGRIPQLSVGTGIASDGQCICFFPARDGYAIEDGMTVKLTAGDTDLEGTVWTVGEAVSAAQAGETADAAWLPMPDDWVCPVWVKTEAPLPQNRDLRAEVVLSEERAITVLMGR